MTTKQFRIIQRFKERDFSFAAASDFTLEVAGDPLQGTLVEDPCLTLYCLDLSERVALFVRTPEGLNLLEQPFLYMAQFTHASHVVKVEFEDFLQLGKGLLLRGRSLIHLHSVGRCGSTLLSQAFAAAGAQSLSEPDVFSQLSEWRGARLLSEEELAALVRASLALSCKLIVGAKANARWLIKYRSPCIEIVDLLAQAAPSAAHLHLTRDSRAWLRSAYRAFVDPKTVDDPTARRHLEDLFVDRVPLIGELQVEGHAKTIAETLILLWIANVEVVARWKQKGGEFFSLDYSEIEAAPEHALRRAFAYCKLEPEDWESVRAVLSRDSQLGSVLAQEKLKQKGGGLPAQAWAEVARLLKVRGHLEHLALDEGAQID